MGRNGPRTIWPIANLIQLYGPESIGRGTKQEHQLKFN